MNEFDRRWQVCAARGREAKADATAAPAGLATRVWAEWNRTAGASTATAWAVLSFRALVVVALALVLCVATELAAAPSASPLTPHIEDAVTGIWEAP